MDALLTRLALLVAIFGSVFLMSHFAIGAFVNRRAELSQVNRRLTMMRAGLSQEVVTNALLKNAPPVLAVDAGLFARLQVSYVRAVMMAALRIESRQLATGMCVAFGVLATVLLALVWTSQFSLTLGVGLLVLVVAAALAFGVPLMIVSRLAQRRRKRMQEQFPIALDIFTRSLRAGHPIASALFLITEEMEDPIGSEFGLVSDEVSYGAEITDALQSMAERWNLEDMRMFVVSVSVQSETGGNLAEILQNLSTVIRSRAAMYMKVRALSSEGRMSALMLTALPVLTFLTMFFLNPGFYLDIAQDSIFLIGFPSLLVLYGIGVLIIRRMVDLKV